MDMPLVGKDLFQPLFRGYYRGLTNCLYYLGVPYYNYSIMGPKTLFYLVRPYII